MLHYRLGQMQADKTIKDGPGPMSDGELSAVRSQFP